MQDVRAALCVQRLQLVELPLADVRLLIGAVALLHELCDRHHDGGTRELPKLPELVLGVRPSREHGEQEPLSGSSPSGCRIVS